MGYTWIYDSINELTAEISFKNQLNLYDEETNYLYNYSFSGYFNYTVNLGSEYYIWMVELGKERYLQGYVRNGDTNGYIMPDDDFLVSLEENKT
ncbi:MAG: hypothetical protein U5Q03_11525 [Bacteroidota bacterium]|nr:hypothetical protein [Bacteroidota bacterium]